MEASRSFRRIQQPYIQGRVPHLEIGKTVDFLSAERKETSHINLYVRKLHRGRATQNDGRFPCHMPRSCETTLYSTPNHTTKS